MLGFKNFQEVERMLDSKKYYNDLNWGYYHRNSDGSITVERREIGLGTYFSITYYPDRIVLGQGCWGDRIRKYPDI